MGTVAKAFADNIARNNGFYNGDDDNSMGDNPRCVMIVEYGNAWGGTSYGLVMETDRDPQRYMRETGYVNNPRVYWSYAA